MRKRKSQWACSSEKEKEKDAALLCMLSRGAKTQSLASSLGTSPILLEKQLERLRESGLVSCTNKIWYRSDALSKYKPPEPKPTRLSEAQIKMLKRQTGFGFGEGRE